MNHNFLASEKLTRINVHPPGGFSAFDFVDHKVASVAEASGGPYLQV